MLAILIICFTGIVDFYYLLPPVVNWDEGTHAIWGYRVFLAMKDLNWPYFWDLVHQQFAYPPLGSLLIAIFNLPFGFSMETTRFVSTAGFILGGILVYLINRELLSNHLGKKNSKSVFFLRTIKRTFKDFCTSTLSNLKNSNWRNVAQKKNLTSEFFTLFLKLLINNLSLIFFLSSPAILFYSVTVFKESWGMALTLLVFYLYFKAFGTKKILPFLWVGFSLVLLFWQKYNYAGLLVITLGLEAVVEGVGLCGLRGMGVLRKMGIYLLRQGMIFLPLGLFSSWWILTPVNKLQWFLDIMRSDWNPVTVGVGTKIEYLLYYVQSIRVSYLFSNVLFIFVLVGYLLSIKDLGLKKIRVLFIFFTLNIVLGTLHSINLQDRYIYTSVPALFLLAGYEWQFIVSRVLSRVGPTQFSPGSKTTPRKLLGADPRHPLLIFAYLLIFISAIIVIHDLFSLPSYLKSNTTHMLSSPMYNESDYHDTLFRFDAREWPKEGQKSKVKSQNYKSKVKSDYYEESPEGVIDYILDKTQTNKPLEIVGYLAEISPDWVELRRAMRREKEKNKVYNVYKTYNNYIVTIEVKETSRLYTFDYKRANSWQLVRVREIENSNKDNIVEKKDFKELGVIVTVFGLK